MSRYLDTTAYFCHISAAFLTTTSCGDKKTLSVSLELINAHLQQQDNVARALHTKIFLAVAVTMQAHRGHPVILNSDIQLLFPRFAILDAQNLCKKLQALAIIKI